MKESSIAAFSKPVLVAAVKLAQKKKLVGPAGGWQEWLATHDPENKFNDPKRHTVERLAAFLASLERQLPNPRNPDSRLVKPQKLLKAALPWLQKTLNDDQDLTAATAAAKAAGDTTKASLLSLVHRTRTHIRYKQKYDIESYQKGWIRTQGLPLPDSATPLVVLAVDCEMCVTADSDKELLQVALVDQHGQQILKELVKPPSEVLDYRTPLTGITADQLQGVTMQREDVAAKIQDLIQQQPGVVLVGHSLHYDLEALKLDHQPVIDTAMLFSYQGLSQATPSLTHLAQELLGKTLRGSSSSSSSNGQQQQQQQQPHDSVEDASAAMALVLMEAARIAAGDGPTAPLTPPAVKVDKDEQAKLCIHKIPVDVTAAAVHAAFAAAVCKAAAAAADCGSVAAAAAAVGSAAVVEVGSAGIKGHHVMLVFKHPGVAVDAFTALPGAVFTDSVGRHSKRLQLPGSSSHVIVRRMVCHNGLAYGRDKPQDRGNKHCRAGGIDAKGKQKRAKKANSASGSKAGQKRIAGQIAAGRVTKKKQKVAKEE